MRAVVQRVREASVLINGEKEESTGPGLLVFLGIEEADNKEDVQWLSGKISRLRVFADELGVMNLSVLDTGGDILLISQFTLHASTRKGNRPSYIRAANPEISIPIYQNFHAQLEKDTGKHIKTGEFGAHMQVNLINDGPVTIIIDTKNRE